MLSFLSKRVNRTSIQGTNIFIDNKGKNIGKSIDIDHVFKFESSNPEITIFENNQLEKRFKIEALKENPNLDGQFLHSTIRIQPNSAVMVDGVISNNSMSSANWTEGLRFQPFYLSDKNEYNLQLTGKGLFERGLHFNGTITPTTVRSICICDICHQSFTLQHFHAGFSDFQYFYSSDSKETLIVPYNALENIPSQLQETIDAKKLEEMEEKLPNASNRHGQFKYYNSFNCPYCLAPYIDFAKYRKMRPKEYYGNTYINETPTFWNGSKAIV